MARTGEDDENSSKDFNAEKAELYETLSHPTRILILQALSKEPMSFSQLKRKAGIDSSGNLAFHLGKLSNFVKIDSDGSYSLADEGKDALRVVEATESTSGKAIKLSLSRRSGLFKRRSIAILLVAVLVLFVAVTLATGFTVYNTHTELIASYNKPYSANYWKSASFNDSQGKELAFFTFGLRGTNQSGGPVPITLQWGPSAPPSQDIALVNVVSVRLTFSSDNFALWPAIGVIGSQTAGGISPTHIERGSNGQEIVTYYTPGVFGKGTNLVNIWFQLTGVGPSSNVNHTVTLTVDMTLGSLNSFFIGKQYNAEAQFPLVVEPSGLIFVSDQNIT